MRDALVLLFLRGGADGLNLVAPYTEDLYYELRPNLALARPDAYGVEGRLLDLDGAFGLNPALAALMPAWKSRELAIVHAIGSDDQTRSHFYAQDRIERAGAAGDDPGSGWMARHLRVRPGEPLQGLAAVCFGTRPPEALRGGPAATLTGLGDYALQGAGLDFELSLAELYAERDTPVHAAGQRALETLDRVARVAESSPAHAGYPDSDLGRSLADVARLVRARVGLEIASIDVGNWDTHFGQPALLPGMAQGLAEALAAFRADLGPDGERVTTVVMTEFGRRVYENASVGTDHGLGSVAFVMGGRVLGGKVYGAWPGLQPGGVDTPSDLAITTDFRDLLAEVVHRGLGNPNVADVFPGWTPRYRGVIG